MRPARWLAAFVLAGAAIPAWAGPPYLTDDPVPTDTGHWEIYGFTAGDGRGSTLDGDAGLDLNYGPADGVQLTATFPLSFAHNPLAGWHSGTGDVELGIKYRFFHDPRHGLSAAIFPRAIGVNPSDWFNGGIFRNKIIAGEDFADEIGPFVDVHLGAESPDQAADGGSVGSREHPAEVRVEERAILRE